MKLGPLAWETKWKTVPFPKRSPNTGWEADVKGQQIILGFHILS